MKGYVASLLIIMGAVMPLHADDLSLSLSISIPASETGERILDPAHTSHFHVILSNQAAKPYRIWAQWSELGYQALSFEFTDDVGKKWKAIRKERFSVSHRLSEFCILQPHENLVYDVYFADADAWDKFPQPKGPQTFSMRAIFEIQSNPGTDLNKVWTGKVVSEMVKVTIYPK